MLVDLCKWWTISCVIHNVQAWTWPRDIRNAGDQRGAQGDHAPWHGGGGGGGMHFPLPSIFLKKYVMQMLILRHSGTATNREYLMSNHSVLCHKMKLWFLNSNIYCFRWISTRTSTMSCCQSSLLEEEYCAPHCWPMVQISFIYKLFNRKYTHLYQYMYLEFTNLCRT